MLQNWLKPIPASLADLANSLDSESFGHSITRFQKEFPNLKKTRIAIIGIGEVESNYVRQLLYQTVFSFPKLAIADLGNTRKTDPSFVIPLIYELLAGKILPIIIGADPTHMLTQFLAYQNTKSLVSMAVVDEKPRLFLKKIGRKEPFTLDPMLSPRHPMLFHFSQIGGQSHLSAPSALSFFEKNHFDFMRLGKCRAAIEETEPLIRDADLFAFHTSAIRSSETAGLAGGSPSGFTCEEACQLARYAGMSDKLTSFGIFGWQKEFDPSGQTAQLITQLVWYFIEGVFNRKSDYPVSTDGLTEYIVDYREHDWSLTFWKSVKSGRWWLQVPVETDEKHQRHRLIPCSFADYQLACREEMPDRLLNAFKRFG